MVGPVSEEVLLVQHPDLIIDLRDVLEFIRVDALCSVLPTTSKSQDVVVQSLVLLIITLFCAQVDVEKFDVCIFVLLILFAVVDLLLLALSAGLNLVPRRLRPSVVILLNPVGGLTQLVVLSIIIG